MRSAARSKYKRVASMARIAEGYCLGQGKRGTQPCAVDCTPVRNPLRPHPGLQANEGNDNEFVRSVFSRRESLDRHHKNHEKTQQTRLWSAVRSSYWGIGPS